MPNTSRLAQLLATGALRLIEAQSRLAQNPPNPISQPPLPPNPSVPPSPDTAHEPANTAIAEFCPFDDILPADSIKRAV